MALREQDEREKMSVEGREDNPSALRDALLNKVKGREGGEAPRVTPMEIGAVAPEEESALTKPLTIGGPGYLDRAIFCRQFATLIEVGIPVLKALQMLAVRTSNGRLRKALRATAQGVEAGQSIHQSMAAHTRVFSPIVVNIVRIGEVGGILEDSLVRLAEIMESKARIRRKVVEASMYPVVALCVAVLVVLVIMVKAIPVFASVYIESGNELPAPTAFVIGLSKFFTTAWPVIVAIIVLAAIGLKMWGKSDSGAMTYSWLALRMPVFKSINQKIGVARFTRTLGGLITAGIPLIDALEIAADTNENRLIGQTLHDVHNQVEKGERMRGPLARADVFPPLVIDMISTGEETGTLDRMLTRLADIYDAEVDSTLNGLSSIIEPLLIILLGGIVIFIALAVLLPYFRMVSVIQG